MQAYIYARYSSLEQGKGTSLARQLDDCRALCAQKGWPVAAEIVDEGRSAYHGVNRAEGSKFAAFEHQVVSGRIGAGSVLVVERLDRLSRQDAKVVFALITRLTDTGLAIATVDGDRLYTSQTIDFANLIELIVKAQLANEESEKKSHRLSAAWRRKRERAAEGGTKAMTRRCPAWIEVDDQGCYALIPERAAIVRRIFALSESGIGQHLIASTLNREGVSTWGRGALASKGWHPSYVQKILNSRATLGEFQPHRKLNGRRTAEGAVIRRHFPAVIDEVDFNRARAARKARETMGGRRGRQISNLLSGMARCAACNSVMTFRNKGKIEERYLVCDGALRGRGCKHRTHFNYPRLEAAVLDSVLHIVVPPAHFEDAEDVRAMELVDRRAKRGLTHIPCRFDKSEG